jgi:hypothetical protein
MGLSFGLQRWGEGGDVFLEALGAGWHTAYSLRRESRLDVTCGDMRAVEKVRGWHRNDYQIDDERTVI